ncbi:MAG: tetratricopeptide repeat protein [Gammaproteobacteria bacterium]|nr:tetratricopeptide repeat protein [Gammaproteobacteria bacterium]
MRFFPVLIALCLGACASAPPATYEELLSDARAGMDVDPAELKRAFLESDDYSARMQRLSPLERQALALLEEEPLKLGAIGTAILDQYYGSLAGHHALAEFYHHVESSDAAITHERWVERVRKNVEANADGSRESPFRVVSASEAQTYLVITDRSPVGSMYHTTNNVPFMMMIAAKPETGRLQNVFFDLHDAYTAVEESVHQQTPDRPFNPGALIGFLAQRDDSAAQAFIGTYLASEDRLDEAAEWLTAASRSGNVLANLMLARVYWTKARTLFGAAKDEAMEFVMENYLHAIAVGSDEAMYTLGALYLGEQFGPENAPSGIALMQQATNLGNTDAMLYLAQMYYQGQQVEQDYDVSEKHFIQAARYDDPTAKLQYARFLMNPEVAKPFSEQAFDWLNDIARQDNAEAMLIIGNLYAKGVHVNQSFRRALSWFRDAATTAPDNSSIINEIAWTLSVTNLDKLRDERYALKIMDHIMQQDQAARQTPAFLDTWAAAHAATGDFQRAVELQQDAVAQATEQQQTDVLDILKEHLQAFQSGETITDAVP